MSNKSKTKGKRGESFICDMLSKCFGMPFMRVFTSGSFFGGKNIEKFSKFTQKQQDLNEGDIVVPEQLNHLSIECKNYKDFPFHSMFTGKCLLLDSWISQASHTKKPFWLLFFKITRKNTYVCHDRECGYVVKDNYFMYRNKYYIELAEDFLANNKNHMLQLKTTDIYGKL